MSYGATRFPGYDAFTGAPLIDSYTNWYGSTSKARDMGSVVGGDNIIRCMIMKDKDFDPVSFDPEAHQKEVLAASELLDAFHTNLDAFYEHGGKLLLLHGCTDSLVPVQSTIDYYESLLSAYGSEKLSQFIKFYLVSGYGHGMGDMFTMDTDLIEVLHSWVTEKIVPDVLIATDANDQENHRTRPLYPYPAYPVYNGEGNINKAENFHPELHR